MNLRITLQASLLLSALALLVFGVSDAINPLVGSSDTLLNKPWHLLALANGLALLAGLAWPYVRGVQLGDALVAFVRRENPMTGTWMEGISVTALQAGRLGARIKVRFGNGAWGEALVQKYAGILTPATVRLLESEMPAHHHHPQHPEA